MPSSTPRLRPGSPGNPGSRPPSPLLQPDEPDHIVLDQIPPDPLDLAPVFDIDEVDSALDNIGDLPLNELVTQADEVGFEQQIDAAIFTRRVIEARQLIRRARTALNRALDITDVYATDD